MPIGTVGCIRNNPSDSANTEDKKGQVQAAVYGGAFWSHLHFENGDEPTLHQYAAIGEIAYHSNNGKSLALNAGLILGGNFSLNDEYEIELKKGVVVSVKGAWNFVKEKKATPFVIASISLSFSKVFAEEYNGKETGFTGTDARLGITAGYTLWRFWQVYISPKVFGGPIFWHNNSKKIQGRDRYFVQAGLGTSFILPKGFVFFINGSVAGEQALGAGLVKSF